MKKITMEEFTSMLKSDKDLAKRLSVYLNGETDEGVIGKKTIEFMLKEGYEIDMTNMQSLSADELENVSGGFNADEFFDKASKVSSKIGRKVGNITVNIIEKWIFGG